MNSKSRKLTDFRAFCCGHCLKLLPPLKQDMLHVKGPDWAEGPTYHAACGTWAGTRVPGASATGHWAETPSAPQGLRREGGGTRVVGVCTGPSKAGSTCPLPTHPPIYLGGPFAAASSEPAARLRQHWTAGALPLGPGSVAAPLPPGLPVVGTGREDTAKETGDSWSGSCHCQHLGEEALPEAVAPSIFPHRPEPTKPRSQKENVLQLEEQLSLTVQMGKSETPKDDVSPQ